MDIQEVSEDDFITINYTSTFNAEDGYMPISIGAKLCSYKNGNEITIGGGSIYLFNRYWDDDLISIADSISGDLFELMIAASNKMVMLDYCDKIAVLEHIQLKKEYRRQGLGTGMLEQIQEYLYNALEVDSILLTAAPIEFDEEGKRLEGNKRKQYIDSLIPFYTRSGFVQFSQNHLCKLSEKYDDELGFEDKDGEY